MIEYPKTKSIQDAIYTGTWTDNKIPVYTVTSTNGLNQLVGYVKHINAANGTVLYRGQCDLHPGLLPSILRNTEALDKQRDVLNCVLTRMITDSGVQTFWNFSVTDIVEREVYQKIAIEAALQHYGAKTFCVDFVDNHWIALWFGLYRWDEEAQTYKMRDSTKKEGEDRFIDFDIHIDPPSALPQQPMPSSESEISEATMNTLVIQSTRSQKPIEEFITLTLHKMDAVKQNSWKQEYEKILVKNAESERKWSIYQKDDSIGHMYLFLYVAETNVPTENGFSLGEHTYTVDLRKALPSTFLRPCSQHGWIVRGKSDNYRYEDSITCVIRINTTLVAEMLGSGSLVKPENFFPSAEYDQGYRVFLQRQEGTNYPSPPKLEKILPQGLISNAFK